MLLGSGIPILRYIYSDTDSSVRAIAKARLQKLSDEYGPTLFPTLAWEVAFDTLPHDIRKVTKDDMYMAGAKDGTQWMVVAGWECQDLSPAGSGTGLEGNMSSTFYPLVQVLQHLQRLQHDKLPAYLLENTAMQHPINAQRGRVEHDYLRICSMIGPCVELDAARVGSYAHRNRDYWTNLALTC